MIKKNSRNILFISSHISRGLILLSRELTKLGMTITIAAPKDGNEKFWLYGEFLPLHKIGRFILPSRRIYAIHDAEVFALDTPSAKFAKRGKMNFAQIDLDFGLDPAIYTPEKATAQRQTALLSKFGIAPHQRMVAVISPLGHRLDELLAAVHQIDRDDFVVTLLGKGRRAAAGKILKQIAASDSGGKVMCVGDVLDLSTFLRASTAVVSLGRHSERLLKATISMGRTTVWDKNEFGIAPNIVMKNDIAGALTMALDLSAAKRAEHERKNLDAAKKFSIEKTIREFLAIR